MSGRIIVKSRIVLLYSSTFVTPKVPSRSEGILSISFSILFFVLSPDARKSPSSTTRPLMILTRLLFQILQFFWQFCLFKNQRYTRLFQFPEMKVQDFPADACICQSSGLPFPSDAPTISKCHWTPSNLMITLFIIHINR